MIDKKAVWNKITEKVQQEWKDYAWMTLAGILSVVGIYFFRFPNKFSFGGLSGLSVVLSEITPFSPTYITLILTVILLIVGFLFLGRSAGIKIVYVSLLNSIGLYIVEYFFPMTAPLTAQPILELVYAIFLPAVGAAILFNMGVSGGGTDIIAMILTKHTNFNIGTTLLVTDFFIAMSSFFVFNVEVGLFSMLGLLVKSFLIDSVIESINLSKYFNVICDNPKLICAFITRKLKRSATVVDGEGAYTHNKKYVVFTVLKRSEALQLRMFIKRVEPEAFMMITSTSEIIGKGFRTQEGKPGKKTS